MPKPFPKGFPEDVVRVARNRGPGPSLKQIATDFGIAESCLRHWMRQADVEDCLKPGATGADNAKLREAMKRRSKQRKATSAHRQIRARSAACEDVTTVVQVALEVVVGQ